MASEDYSFFPKSEWNDVWVKATHTPLEAEGLLKLALDYDDKKYYYAYITSNLKYAVVGFSYLSADGDFKDIYIDVRIAEKLAFSKKWIKHYTELENEAVEYYNKKKASIIAPKAVVDQRLEILLLTISNFMIYMNLHTKRGGVHEKNVHPFFNDNYPLQTLMFYFKNKDNEKGKKIYEYHEFFSEIKNKSDNIRQVIPYGQKISPVKLKEIKNFKNPSYQLWRELLLNKYIYLLTVNNLTRGISCLRYYYFIKDDFSVYNNYLIFNKVFNEQERKPLESEIVLLSESLNTQKFSSDNYDVQKKDEEKNEWVDVHLVQIFNNVGTTYYSKLVDALDRGTEKTRYPVLFDYEQFRKYIFEFIWNFICLNIMGAIHGDCHLNNVTIQPHFPNREGDEREKYVKFTIEDETYIFVYRAIGTLIDYSRCWFFEKNSLEENLQLSSPFQIDQIVNKYSGLFTEFIDKYEDKLRTALIERNDEVLRIISCIDSYSITYALEVLLKTTYDEKKANGTLNYKLDEQIRFITKLNIFTKNIMTREMADYLDGKLSAKQIGYPLHRILQHSFHDHLEDPTKDYSKYHFVDHLNTNNGMKINSKEAIGDAEKRGVISMKAFNSDYKKRMLDFTKYTKNAEIVATR
jgi:hypothetical protein